MKLLAILILFSMVVLPKPALAGVAAGTTVVIRNNQFNPQNIQVVAGTTVTWVNQDSVTHTSTSDSTTAGEIWDSGNINPGQSYSKTFTQVGTFNYHCSVHPSMRGSVQVVAAQIVQQLPATGPPIEAIPIIGLIPFGYKLLKFGKLKEEKESPQTLWEKRQFKLL